MDLRDLAILGGDCEALGSRVAKSRREVEQCVELLGEAAIVVGEEADLVESVVSRRANMCVLDLRHSCHRGRDSASTRPCCYPSECCGCRRRDGCVHERVVYGDDKGLAGVLELLGIEVFWDVSLAAARACWRQEMVSHHSCSSDTAGLTVRFSVYSILCSHPSQPCREPY